MHEKQGYKSGRSVKGALSAGPAGERQDGLLTEGRWTRTSGGRDGFSRMALPGEPWARRQRLGSRPITAPPLLSDLGKVTLGFSFLFCKITAMTFALPKSKQIQNEHAV